MSGYSASELAEVSMAELDDLYSTEDWPELWHRIVENGDLITRLGDLAQLTLEADKVLVY